MVVNKFKIITNFFINHKLFLVFLVSYFLLTIFTYKDFGITADEELEYKSGRYYASYYLGTSLPDNFNISERHLPENSTYLRLYTAFLGILNFKGYYEWYHFLNMIFASSLFIFAYFLFYYFYHNSQKAILAPLFIFITPRILGDIPTNTKDIPFATLYLFGIFLIFLRSTKYKNNFFLVLLGLVFGLTQSTRVLGLSLHVVFFLYNFIFCKVSLKKNVLESLFVFLVSILVTVAVLPILHNSPLQGLYSLIFNSTKFDYWNNLKFYNGEFLDKTQNPYLYSLVWILITIPTFQLILIIFSLPKLKRLKDHKLLFLLIFTFLINLSLIIILNPVLYNGPRHFLFLLMIISLITVVLFIELTDKFLKKIIVVAMFFTIMHLILLHPYQYIYFSEHFGGLLGAKNRFEMDYWGATYSEASKKLANQLNLFSEIPSVYSCNVNYVAAYYSQGKYSIALDSTSADYIICDYENAKLLKTKITPIYTVQRFGVPLNFVAKNEKN